MNNLQSSIVWQQFFEQLPHLSFFLLQGAALVGFVALLLVFNKKEKISSPDSLAVGWLLGIACFCMTALLWKQMQSTIKLAVMTEYIFVAGFIGGWRNALTTLCLVSFTRLIFGGPILIGPAIFDYTFVALGSLPAHWLIFSQKKYPLTWPYFVLLVVWRVYISLMPPILIYWSGFANENTTALILGRRLGCTLTVSLFIIGTIYLLLEQTAKHENKLNTDKTSGLPDHQAFLNFLDQLSLRENKNTPPPCALLLIQITNTQELRQTVGFSGFQSLVQTVSKELRELLELSPISTNIQDIFSFPDRNFAIVVKGLTKEDIQQDGIAQTLFNKLVLLSKKQVNTICALFQVHVIDIKLDHNFNASRFLRALTILEKQPIGHVQYLETPIEQQVSINERIIELLASSAKGGKIPLWLQPKVILSDSMCYGAEALMRVPGLTPESYINPHSILLTAEKHHLQYDLEWAIIRSAAEHLGHLTDYLSSLTISVNLTPHIFTAPRFSTNLIELMEEKKLSPGRLILEIIETDRFVDSETVKNNIGNLVQNGFYLSLDDFGTGYSSLTLLSKYQFRELKLDYSMISHMSNPRMYSAIQLSIESANRYQASVVAEGIETEQQLLALQQLGVTHGQGFLFGKAMPIDAFMCFARENLQNRHKATAH